MVEKTIISTFAGCGGSSLGYKWAGFKELLAIDFDKNAVDTFKLNFPEVPVWHRDITQVSVNEILEFCNISPGTLDILDGSPPCQGFSTAGKRQVNDPRNSLFKEYVRLIEGLQPKVFVMENVSGMIKGPMKGIFIEILTILKGLGYNVKCKLMNAKYYEVPQSRERLIFIGVRNDLNKEPVYPIPSTKLITVKEAWQGLPPQGFIDVVPKLKQGEKVSKYIPNKHHQTIRIRENKPCPTLTKVMGGIGFGSLIHPIENRVLSIDEMKRCSTFPDDFKFMGKYQEQKARIGNAVMPKFMYHIAMTIKEKIL